MCVRVGVSGVWRLFVRICARMVYRRLCAPGVACVRACLYVFVDLCVDVRMSVYVLVYVYS